MIPKLFRKREEASHIKENLKEPTKETGELNKIRVLFVGFHEYFLPKVESNEEIFSIEAFYAKLSLPTIYDYQVIFISADAIKKFTKELNERKKEFDEFFNAPFKGVVIVPLVGGIRDNYLWTGVHIKVIDKAGDAIELNKNNFLFNLLNKNKEALKWSGQLYDESVDRNALKDSDIIARNIIGKTVSFQIKRGNGLIIFLPDDHFYYANSRTSYLRDLLTVIKSKTELSSNFNIPIWSSSPKYVLGLEYNLQEKIKEIRERISKLEKAKSILWLSGNDLTSAICFVLKEMGINCKNTEKDGKHDIEINERKLKAVIEVKGLKGCANADNLRQLEDWKRECIKSGKDNIKGIFILNEFREVEPELRKAECKKAIGTDYPFTKDAIRIAERENFVLMTTYQLFRLYKENIDGKFNKNEFLEKILSSKTIFDY